MIADWCSYEYNSTFCHFDPVAISPLKRSEIYIIKPKLNKTIPILKRFNGSTLCQRYNSVVISVGVQKTVSFKTPFGRNRLETKNVG